MIRVLQFADVVNRHDFIDTIVRYADRGGFRVGVCVRTAESNIADPGYDDRVPHWVLPGLGRRDLFRTAWRLASLLRRWRADVLHTHHFDQAVIGWLATRLHRRTRLVVGRHYSDAIYRSAAGFKRKALLAVEQAVNAAADRIIAPSRLISDILTVRQGVDRGKVDCIPYGFHADKYVPPDETAVARLRTELGLVDAFVIGNFSRLHEEKGHRFLVEAVRRLRPRVPRLAVLIVGEGPERPALERQVRDSALSDTVRLLGWRRDAMSVMAAVDVVVQPTLQEAFSQVMAEALWMGKPLVISQVSGAPDVITDGVNGLLVPPGDPDSLAAAIDRVADDPALRARVVSAGRTYVETHLTIDRVIAQYEAAYLRAVRP